MSRRQRVDRGGFTLVEILVVLSIIVLLIAVLLPALGRSREAARRALCASNLRQFAIVTTSYSIDNKGHLLATDSVTPTGSPNFRYPFQAWTIRVNKAGLEEFSLPAIGPWMPGGNVTLQTMGLVWKCPSADSAVQDAWTSFYWNQPGNMTVPLSYSYIARGETWGTFAPGGASAVARPEITDKELIANRVLLADNVFYWGYGATYLGGAGGWGYNHGNFGPHLANANVAGGNPDPGPPSIAGVNRAYGDGHVLWIGEESFPASRLQATDPTLRWIYGDLGDKTIY